MVTRELIWKSSTLALIAVALTACASDDSPTTDTTPGDSQLPPPGPLSMPCGPLNSGFPGDERCILPPDPSLGIQLHVGPKDYTDQAEIDKFILQPGEEKTECYHFSNPSPETISFFRQVYRMRQGSHHLIIHTMLGGTTSPPEGWYDCYGPEGDGFMPIGGTQDGLSEFPPNGNIAPEDQLLGRPLTANAPMIFELHFYNSTTKPILREAWVNFEKKVVPAGQTMQILGGIFMGGGHGLSLPAGETQTLDYWCDNDLADRRVVSLFGHRHAHTERFSVWMNRGTEREELVYEDYNWHDTKELIYNSRIDNGASDRATQTSGGYSGILTFQPGDRIEWECEIDNTTDNENGVLPSEQPLTFANEVYTGEMCMLFGSMVNNSVDPSTAGIANFFWGNRTSVTPSGTTPPTATIGGTPLGPWTLVIDALASDATTVTVRFSTDGGNIWSDPVTVSDDSVPVALIDPAIGSRVGDNGQTGLTVAFASGTFNTDNLWTAKTLCSSRR